MTKRSLILFVFLGVALSTYLATAPVHATTYLWGLNMDGTPASQPTTPPDSHLNGPYAGPNLGLTTAQFDTYVATVLPAGSYWGPVSINYSSGPSNYYYYGAFGGGFGLTNWLVSASYNQSTGYFSTCTQQSGPIIVGGSPLQGGGIPPGTTCGENRPSISLTATPSTINLGESSTLSGLAAYVSSCSIDHGIGNVGNSWVWLPVTPTVTTTYTMTCQTSGAPISASATVTVIGSAVNGTCGTSNGTTVSSAPSSGLCSAGTASSVSGSGPWAWSCAGSGGGTTASCSAALAQTAPPPPTGLTYSCNAAGNQVTLNWNAAPGATNYYVRNQEVISGTSNYVDGVVPTTYTYNITPNVQYGWWVHSNVGPADYNPAHYSAAAFGPNFSCGGQPDLTAGNVTSTSATAGTPVTLASTITNSPAASTGAAFTDLFQRADDAAGTVNVVDIRTYANSALAAGGSNTASVSYPFPSVGTYYVRACADKASAGNAGVITESNEANNCSNSWTRVDVSAAVIPPLSCSVSPSSGNVTVPGSATYTASGASAPYTWTAPDGGSYGTTAQATRPFSSAGGPYAMTVSKAGYTPAACLPNVTASAVAPSSCTGGTASITASSTRVQLNQTTTVSYNASFITTSCVIKGSNGYTQTIPANSCTIPGNGGSFTTAPITTQTTYTITCDGIAYPPVIINVQPKFQEF
jgi:hypothetical protein